MNYNRLVFLQEKQKLSDDAMGEIIEMSGPGYKKMIKKGTATVKYIEIYAQHFNVPVSYFFEENDNLVEEPTTTFYSCPDCVKKQREIDELKIDREKYMRKYIDCLEDLQEKKSAVG